MRRAAARVARRRGSSITIRRLPSHGSSSSASGTTVVLPAPGAAWRTARPTSANAARSSSRAPVTGSDATADGSGAGTIAQGAPPTPVASSPGTRPGRGQAGSPGPEIVCVIGTTGTRPVFTVSRLKDRRIRFSPFRTRRPPPSSSISPFGDGGGPGLAQRRSAATPNHQARGGHREAQRHGGAGAVEPVGQLGRQYGSPQHLQAQHAPPRRRRGSGERRRRGDRRGNGRSL